jgi:DNA-binding NarL/FixJ family response regulator
MLSAYHNEAFITRSMESGAWGHLSKESCVKELVRAIESVHSGVVAF